MLSLLPKVATARNIERKLRYLYRGRQSTVPVFGEVPCRITGCAQVDAWSFLPGHHDPRKGVKHVILSLPRSVPKEDKWVSTFGRFAKCFSERFCSGAPFIGALHWDTDQTHAEILFRNSDGRRALHWSKGDLHAMQSCDWVPRIFRDFLQIVPARGNGFGHGSRTHSTQMVSYLLADYFTASDALTLSEVNSFEYSALPESPRVRVFGKTVRTIGLARGVEARRRELGYSMEMPTPMVIRPEGRSVPIAVPKPELNPFAPPRVEEMRKAGEGLLHIQLPPEHGSLAMGYI